MKSTVLQDFLSSHRTLLARGPIAIVFAEDEVEVASTVRHILKAGFPTVLLLGSAANITLGLPDEGVFPIPYDVYSEGAVAAAVNKIIGYAHGQWIFFCFNGEYLFHPFCETRDITELLAFHTEERREAMLTYVLDIYARDLSEFPNAVSRETAMLDSRGYYALRRFRGRASSPMERQLDFFGGLRWRFEEHIPQRSRKIDRISLFKAKPGLQLREDHTLSGEEMNTFACPWHNNLTGALLSFRAAKALRRNPGSKNKIDDFKWSGSRTFDWSSQQLMDLGFIEPGQWF